jgi:hypothetical protein
MRTISPALLAHLQGDTRTLANLWKITRQDGNVYGFTDHDTAILFGGITYGSLGGFSASTLEMSSDMSTSNAEVIALFDGGSVNEADMLAGVWDNAAITISLVNYMDLSMGALVLAGGFTGQFKIMNGKYVAEFRSLAQIMQQEVGQIYSPTCRASLGDSRCKVPLGPLTYNGTVATVPNYMQITDPGLTQTGPTSQVNDKIGYTIPTQNPYTIQVVPPTGGGFVANVSVTDAQGNVWTQVSGAPNTMQYNVSPSGLYTFSAGDTTKRVFINYTYSLAYFAYGTITFTSGQNKGFKTEIKTSSVGSLTFALPLPYKPAPGDTYTVVAGCDRQFGTCKARFNNVVNFRGEHLLPGTDNLVRIQSN